MAWDYIIGGIIILAAGLVLWTMLRAYEWARVVAVILIIVGAILLIAGVAFMVMAASVILPYL